MRDEEVEDSVTAGRAATRRVGGQTYLWWLRALMRCFCRKLLPKIFCHKHIISEQRLKISGTDEKCHHTPKFYVWTWRSASRHTVFIINEIKMFYMGCDTVIIWNYVHWKKNDWRVEKRKTYHNSWTACTAHGAMRSGSTGLT